MQKAKTETKVKYLWSKDGGLQWKIWSGKEDMKWDREMNAIKRLGGGSGEIWIKREKDSEDKGGDREVWTGTEKSA